MNSYNVIRDQYEDALLARLMEAVRTAQGQAALEENEHLREDPDAAVPKSLDQKCRQLIRRGYQKGQLRRSGRATLRVVSRVAIIAAVLMLTFALTYAVSPAIRTATSTWIATTFKDHTEIISPLPDDYDPSSPDPRKTLFDQLTLEVGWIPDGFSLVVSKDDEFEKMARYRNSDWAVLLAQVDFSIGSFDLIDTEDSDISYLEFSGITATLISKRGGNKHIIMWFIEDAGATVFIYGENVSEEDTITFAKNISIK